MFVVVDLLCELDPRGLSVHAVPTSVHVDEYKYVGVRGERGLYGRDLVGVVRAHCKF
jgi:hypothetical protein